MANHEDRHRSHPGQDADPLLNIVMAAYVGGALVVVALVFVYVAWTYQPKTEAPRNLTAHTTLLAELFAETLRAHQFPAQNIRVVKIEERQDGAERWLHTSFEVLTPPRFHWGDVEGTLQAALIGQDIAMTPVSRSGAAQQFTLNAEHHEFGAVLFHTPTTAAPQPHDVFSCTTVRARVRAVALQQGVSPEGLSIDTLRRMPGQEEAVVRFTAFLPDKATPEEMRLALSRVLEGTEARVELRNESAERRSIRVYIGAECCVELVCILPPPAALPPKQDAGRVALLPVLPPSLPSPIVPSPIVPSPIVPSPIAPRRERPLGEHPRIAIILDDGGYGGPATDIILSLDNRLTLAILPDTPFGQNTARTALELGFEIMLHMPMETESATVRPFPGELKVDMSREEIVGRTREWLVQYPGIVGVNNHTGTAFVADEEKIRWFLEEVARYDIYFVDSRTTTRTRAYNVAVELGIPSSFRDIFLDNSSDPDAIRKQLVELVERARNRGHAIGIGHFRRNTAAVLAEELPKFEEWGVVLTPASELVQ